MLMQQIIPRCQLSVRQWTTPTDSIVRSIHTFAFCDILRTATDGLDDTPKFVYLYALKRAAQCARPVNQLRAGPACVCRPKRQPLATQSSDRLSAIFLSRLLSRLFAKRPGTFLGGRSAAARGWLTCTQKAARTEFTPSCDE
eukprot:5615367-Pleurochrysis_carterae.AAC.2